MKRKIVVLIAVILCAALVLGLGIGLALHFRGSGTPSDPPENAPADDETGTPNDDENKEIDFSALTYAALGDSVTFAQLPKQPYVPMKTPYCEIVKDTLGLKAVYNYGRCGSTIAKGSDPMCERYVNMADGFDIVSVMGGGNDSSRGTSIGTITDSTSDTFFGGLNILAKGLKEKYPNAFIFFMTPLKNANENPNRVLCRNAMLEFCAENDFPVLDLYNECPFENEMYKDYSDGVHPSQEFHTEVLAPLIAEFIRENYGKPYAPPQEEEIDFSALTYVALGDSITFAQLPKQPYVPMKTPYCETVKETLGLKAVNNYGICGSTIAKGYEPMCERYQDMDEADIVSVFGGTNDWGLSVPIGTISDTSTSTFYGALNVLAKGLKDKYPNAFIFFMTPLKRIDEKSNLSVFCKAIKDVCARYDIPVLDLYNECPFEDEMYKDFSDGLHPSQEFHTEVLAPLIAEFIRENYGKPYAPPQEEETDFSALTYAALGDSITFGADYGRGYEAMDVPYCTEVGTLLGLKSVTNYGISGTCLSDIRGQWGVMSRRYVDMADGFDIVSVLGGVNDCGSNAPLGDINSTGYDTIYGSLNILAKGLKEKYPNAFIFFMTPLPARAEWFAGNLSYALPDVATAIKTVCAKYGIPVLDLYNECPYEDEMYESFSDGLHPSQEFHKNVLAPLIAEFIRDNYGK